MLCLATYLGSTREMSNTLCRPTEQISLPARTTAFRKRASATAILRTGRHRRCRPLVFVTEVDSTLGKVVRGHFDGDSIAGEDADAVFLHPAGRIVESLVPIVELYSKTRIGEQLLHGALERSEEHTSELQSRE